MIQKKKYKDCVPKSRFDLRVGSGTRPGRVFKNPS